MMVRPFRNHGPLLGPLLGPLSVVPFLLAAACRTPPISDDKGAGDPTTTTSPTTQGEEDSTAGAGLTDWGNGPERPGEESTPANPGEEDEETRTEVGDPSEEAPGDETPGEEMPVEETPEGSDGGGGSAEEPSPTGALDCLVYAEATRNRVRRYQVDDGSVTTLATVGSPHGLDVDLTTGNIYVTTWPTGTTGSLEEIDTTGSVRTLYTLGAGGQGLAADSSSRRLYWGEYYDGLFVGSMDGERTAAATRLVTTSTMRTLAGSSRLFGVGMGVSIDPDDEQLAFFSRDGSASTGGDAIWEVGLDGSGLGWVWRGNNAECMAVDFEAGQVYYMIGDGVTMLRAIWRIALDGSGAEKLFEMPDEEVCTSIAWDPVDEWLYMFSYPLSGEISTLRRMREDGSELEVLIEDVRGSRGLKLLYDGADGGICSR